MPAAKPALPPLPSFVIIGAPGCATRWLRFNLDRHPEIYAPPRFSRPRAAFLFDDELMTGPEVKAYRRTFIGWDGEPIVGAFEPECMVKQSRPDVGAVPLTDPKLTARRLRKALPEARVILMVRNPIDRIEVAFRRAVQRGEVPPDADLAEMSSHWDIRLINLDLYAGSMYTEAINEYRSRFADRFLVLFYDDVVDDPGAVYRAALEHVGASTDFVPEELERVRYDLPDTGPAPMSREDRLVMYDWAYRIQVTELEELTGRDLSHWDPAVEANV